MASPFRQAYRELSPQEQAHVAQIKSQAESLYRTLVDTPNRYDCREMSLAKTKLEEAVMWAVKAVTA